jgi:formamidopyrimidine-DNA glycosylase
LMHFGMTGWLKFKSEDTYYYKKKVGEEDEEEWPPRFWKFHLVTKEEPKVEAAFVDSRRFARVRLLDCAAQDIRKISPLKENGPDPVVDKELVTLDWLLKLCRRKKIPIKALLLDQANISGIGNWVGDEIMYHAQMHPEQYSNTLSDEQIKQLHQSLHYICTTAVDLLADSDNYPEDWLFKHRWGKGKKDAPKSLPNGDKIIFLTVGGRTSAVVPSRQKKTGPVAKEMSAEAGSEGEEVEDDKKSTTNGVKAGKKRKSIDADAKDADLHGEPPGINGAASKAAPAKRQRKSKFKEDLSDEETPAAESKARSKKTKPAGHDVTAEPSSRESRATKQKRTDTKTSASATASKGKRRSGRLSRT